MSIKEERGRGYNINKRKQQLSVPVIGEDGDSKAFSKWIFNQIHISTPKAEIQLKTDEKLGHTEEPP